MKQAVNWHPADILAAITKRGSNLTRLAREKGISASATIKATRQPCFVGEQVIAAYLGVHPKEIWPTRYDSDGEPLHPRIRSQSNVLTSTTASQKCGAA